jgi:phosphopantothenoylcysteine decarboxylase / phosphopantothenate---cysteine ligase
VSSARRLLITAGPTHEPIDSVRFIGNRSSGKLGIALADAAAQRGWQTTLLLGPVPSTPSNPQVVTKRFRTCEDLRALLREEAPGCGVLVMAAAVADYRPIPHPAMSGGKFRRTGEKMMLELEPTPDLLAEVGRSRRPDQLLVGFALEPRAEMISSGMAKIERKKIDLCVTNPLETMESSEIEAVVLDPTGAQTPTPGKMSKADFAGWLMGVIEARVGSKHT